MRGTETAVDPMRALAARPEQMTGSGCGADATLTASLTLAGLVLTVVAMGLPLQGVGDASASSRWAPPPSGPRGTVNAVLLPRSWRRALGAMS